MTEPDGQGLLHIKKYPNRRYYDTTRSCHVTLREIHDLVVGGRDVCVTDSRTGDDITNLVLMQLIIERDQPKLDLFPSSVMHMIVRANRQALRGYMDQFFTPFLGAMVRSRDQFDTFMRRMMSGQFVSPAEWAGYMSQAFGSVPSASSTQEAGESTAREPAVPEPMGGASGDPVDDRETDPQPMETADDLREQLARLTKRIEELSDGGTEKPES